MNDRDMYTADEIKPRNSLYRGKRAGWIPSLFMIIPKR